MRKFLAITVLMSLAFTVLVCAQANGSEKETEALPAVKRQVLSAFGDVKDVKVSKKGVVSLTIADRSGKDVVVALSELEKDATVVVTYIKKDDANVVKTISVVKSAAAPKSAPKR